jgi:serine/threonine-protein kinase
VRVPDVTGDTLAAAEATLTNEELVVGNVIKRASSTQAPGTVIAQSPVPGNTLHAGGKVELTVAKAPREVEVPNVVGAAEVAAVSHLKHSGFVPSVQTRATTEQSQVGVVLEQTPAGASRARKGTTVTIVVGMLGGTTTGTTTTPTTTTGTTTTPASTPPAGE